MKAVLSARRLQLELSAQRAIDLAVAYGFDAVEPDPVIFSNQRQGAVEGYTDSVRASNLRWGSLRLPVSFADSPSQFEDGLAQLSALSRRLKAAGVTTLATWITPGHDAYDFAANLEMHVIRMRSVARIVEEHGLRVALEYVSPVTFRSAFRYSFVHSLAQVRDLIATVGSPTYGLVLDSFHWHAAGETVQDLEDIRSGEILCIDISDAPVDSARVELLDRGRLLPFRTGAIDAEGFMRAVGRLNPEADIQVEPYGPELESMTPEDRVIAARAGIKEARQFAGLEEG